MGNLRVDGGVICPRVGMQASVINMLIQMLHVLARTARIEHRDAGFGKMPLHSAAAMGAGARRDVLARFTWDAIAGRCLHEYELDA